MSFERLHHKSALSMNVNYRLVRRKMAKRIGSCNHYFTQHAQNKQMPTQARDNKPHAPTPKESFFPAAHYVALTDADDTQRAKNRDARAKLSVHTHLISFLPFLLQIDLRIFTYPFLFCRWL